MNPQQLHDYIIKPALQYMGGNYYSKDAAFLLLCTAAIESNCGEYIKQINGPALGIWQMEPTTEADIWVNCDVLFSAFANKIRALATIDKLGLVSLMHSPLYACAMARLKYAMDSKKLPSRENLRDVYDYYKRVYNTPLGASTWEKFKQAVVVHKILDVKL